MGTRSTIRAQTRTLIGQTDPANSQFSDSEIDSFTNQAIGWLATFLEYPRDFVEIQAEDGAGIYTLLSDTLLIRTSYFGNVNIKDDIKPLRVLSEETLKELFPNWLDETDQTKGTPRYLILLNRRQIFIYPRPNADSSLSGKKIQLNYVFAPASLSSDGDVPDLPIPYHDVIQHFNASMAYAGKLQRMDLSKEQFVMFTAKVNTLKPTLIKETQEAADRFFWGQTDDLEPGTISSVADLRL